MDRQKCDLFSWLLLDGCNFPTTIAKNDEYKAFQYINSKKPVKKNDTRSIKALVDIDDIYLRPIAVQYLRNGKVIEKITNPEDQLGHIENEKVYTPLKLLTNKELSYLNGYKAKGILTKNKVYTTLKIPERSYIFCGSAYFLFTRKIGYILLEAGTKFRKGEDIYEVLPFKVHRDDVNCKYKRLNFDNELIFWEFKKVAN